MLPPEVEYFKGCIEDHIALFFNEKAKAVTGDNYLRFLPYDDAVALKENILAIPYDIPVPNKPGNPYKVSFNYTELTVWNKIPSPDKGDWTPLPDKSSPLWYRDSSGTLIPAWNLFGNLFHLLTFGEEINPTQRDAHGRFAAAFSPRLEQNLIEVPAFNEAVATIVAACDGLHENGRPNFHLNNLLKPPNLVLSHDCDILLGNDFWTQAVRGARIFLPLLKAKPPKLDNAWWLVRNAVTPKRFYFDNVNGMIDIERCFGYNSTFYVLNGSGGRFGARYESDIIPELQKQIPPKWDIGMHYNYNTFLDAERFEAQVEQLKNILNTDIIAGRAHYLKFDPEKSFPFLQKYGIRVDESSGYADRIGYRNGIAGCFRPYDPAQKRAHDIWEIPMIIMDAVLVRQYGDRYADKFSQLLNHLKYVGGALSVIFHPGQFFNPEYKHMLDVYHNLLMRSRDLGAVSETAKSLTEKNK